MEKLKRYGFRREADDMTRCPVLNAQGPTRRGEPDRAREAGDAVPAQEQGCRARTLRRRRCSCAGFSGAGKEEAPENVVFRGLLTSNFGRGDMIRTCDFYVPNVALYQAELHPVGAAYVNDTPEGWQHFVKKILHKARRPVADPDEQGRAIAFC